MLTVFEIGSYLGYESQRKLGEAEVTDDVVQTSIQFDESDKIV